jgi:hypothetical protein
MSAVLTDSTGRRWRQADINALCAAAYHAYCIAGPRSTQKRFTWQKRAYIAQWSVFRILVRDTAGHPIACRWW